MNRLEILKTYKLFIGGQFPRTESGRYYTVQDSKGKLLANVCLASRKDFRNSVVSARKAWGSWAERPAFNRGQIVYRIAEMLEGRKVQFIEELVQQGVSAKNAQAEVELSIDRLVYYAGWCDKYQQVCSSVNPVASNHFNFSTPEAMGVIGVIAPQNSGLVGLVSTIIPALVGGNTVVALASEKLPLCAITFAEVLATSDLPDGVVNILTGTESELIQHFAEHMDVNAVVYSNENEATKKQLETVAACNVKRILAYKQNLSLAENQGLHFITDLQEIKTTWHPIEKIGGATSTY
jgi:acyl-CoA reductase-like NAD-dependent aldehyde dehydrogenase